MVLKKIFTRRKVNLGPFNMYKKNRVRTHSSTPEKRKREKNKAQAKYSHQTKIENAYL